MESSYFGEVLICCKQILMKSIIFLFVMSAFLDYSCRQNFSPSVDQSLGLAGENRQELEKVLKHYRQNDSDSLKLKAACKQENEVQ